MLRTRSTDTVPKFQKTDKADKGAAVSPGFPEFLQYTVVDPADDDSLPSKNAVHVDMLDHIPTRRQSQILYKGFMSGVHPLSPIIHPPIISKLYNAFWDWYDYGSFSGVPCPDPSFIPLLYAIWYGGSVTVSVPTIKAEFNAPSRFALATIYSQQVTDWLTKVSFPHKPSLQSLAAYLISQTILSKEEEPLSSCLFVSLAVSVGQTMGLHRDPAQFNIGAWEAEYRVDYGGISCIWIALSHCPVGFHRWSVMKVIGMCARRVRSRILCWVPRKLYSMKRLLPLVYGAPIVLITQLSVTGHRW